MWDEELIELAERAGGLLRDAGLTVAVAESCTGGLLGGVLTAVPGSSAYFLGGVVAYHDSLKTGLLGVRADVLAQHGAVSAQCAVQMAQGVCRATGADIGIAITGIAGPTGGTPEKPVGTTYIALVGQDMLQVERFLWQGGRESNRTSSVRAALKMLLAVRKPRRHREHEGHRVMYGFEV
jgi:nicotinamide-nucleotide amidase